MPPFTCKCSASKIGRFEQNQSTQMKNDFNIVDIDTKSAKQQLCIKFNIKYTNESTH